jgi:hypothetical protein
VFNVGPQNILVWPKLTDGNCFNIFLNLHCNAITFKRLFTRSKHWEEIECSKALRRYRENYETGNIQPIKGSGLKIGPTREEAKRNSAPVVQ